MKTFQTHPSQGGGFFYCSNAINSGNHISAEIAARMMVQDYPCSDMARGCLARVMDMGLPQAGSAVLLVG